MVKIPIKLNLHPAAGARSPWPKPASSP